MCMPRWLSALLIVALILSSAPATVLAAPAAPTASEQVHTAASTSSYLLIVTPPEVSIPSDAGAFDTAGYVNVEHAQHYAGVQAQLDLLQQQGMIAGYVAQPAAYTFAVSGANPEAAAQLALLGQLQPTGELSTASVGALTGSYQQRLSAEIAAATRLRTQAVPYPAPLAPAPDPESLQAPAVAAIGEIGAAAVVAPVFTVQLHSNSVYGTVAQGTVVTATLKSAAGVAKGTDIAFASFGDAVYLSLKDTFDNPVSAVPGDIVEVQAPDLITIPVVDLRAMPDPASGQIMGIAPANVTSTDPASPPTLSLDLAPSYFLTTTASGTFAISSPWVERGRQWQMRFTNAQGHQVVLNGMVPILVLRGWFSNSQGQYQGDSNVSGAVVAANAVVTVTLTHPGSSAVVNFTRSTSQGTFDLHLSDLYGNPVDIQAGDTIQATDGIVTLTSIAPAFAVTSDPDANRLSGTTNATVVTDTLGLPGTLALWPTDLGDYLYGKLVLAPAGSFVAENPFYWSANPMGPPVTLDWNPGQEGHLRYVDTAGNVVYANFTAPTLDPVLQLRGDGYSYSNNTVYGSVGYCGYGTLALVDAAGAVKDQNSVYACNGFATEFLDVYGNPLPILDGDSVVATFNGRTTTTKAPSLSLAADAKADIVSGQITAGLVTTTTYGAPQSLAVFADMYSYANSKMVAPDGAGNFVADFSGSSNIAPGSSGLAMYIDAKGNKVYAKWDAPVDKPKISLRGGSFYYYYGSGYQADNYVFVGLPQSNCSLGMLDLAVKAQDGATRWRDTIYVGCSSNTALYLTDDFGNDINLDAGDVVEATFGGQTASVTVPSFEVISDPKANTVSGVTNAAVTTTTVGLTQTLSVWPDSLWDVDLGKYVQVAGTAFSATNPFYAGADPLNWPVSMGWNAGDEGHLRYIDAAGNTVYASFAALVEQPKLGIQKGGNWVGGMVPAGNAPVTITVTSGATVKGVGYDTSSLAGRFGINLYDGSGNPLTIAEGDQVVLVQPETTVTVPPLSVNIDIDQDLVSGSGPANSLLNVKQPESPLQAPRSVTTGGDGSYMADFRGIADLAPGVLVQVEYENAAGHSIWVERYAGTMLAAALNTNRVWGYTPDENTPVVVTVKRAGSVIGMDSFTFMGSGHFTAFPVDATGKPIVLVAGDVLELDLGAGVVKTLTLASLAMAIDNQANLLSGVGPAASLLGVTAAAQPAEYDDSVLTNAAGQWTVDLAAKAKDIEPGAVASVRYSANGIDTTWLFDVSSYFILRDGGNNVVKGYAAPYAPVTITLLRNGGVLAVTHEEAADSGWYWSDLYDVNGLQVDIKAGDVVEVKSAQAMSVTVPTLQASVDNGARTVHGTGPANAIIGVFTSNWNYYGGKTVKTDANGAFSVSLAQDYVGGQVWLRYREPQGNWIYAYSTQQSGAPVYLYARWNTATGEYLPHAVSGSAGGGPRQVLLTLRRGEQVVATAAVMSNADGSFNALLRDSTAGLVDIKTGDVIAMVAGDVSKEMTVPALSVQTNLESATLFGTGPANAPLQANGSSCGGGTTVDLGGNWVVQCGGLDVGASGWIRVTDLLGNRTFLGWSTPFVSVQQNGNEVDGTTALGAQVHVQLLRGVGVVGEAIATADESNGYFAVEFRGNGSSPIIIRPHDTVVVYAAQTITVPVTPLSATADNTTDRVSGVGPAGQDLDVYVWTNGFWGERTVTTAADGSYTADFSGTVDVRPSSWVSVAHFNEDGNEVWTGSYAPLVRINVSSDIVDGYATPNALASLVLKRGGSPVASASAPTGIYGDFSAYFLDGAGNLVDLVAGDVVEVTASPTVTTAAITLTASVEAGNDTVSGEAPAGAPVLVVAYRCTPDGGCYSAETTAIASDAGIYVANFAGVFDLDLTSYAYVQAADAEGNETSIATTPPETPQLQDVQDSMLAAGAMLLHSFYGTANRNNLTPPQVFNMAGGGRLIFIARGGDLVVTAPDGTITRPASNYFTVQNPRTGKWQVQVETWSDNGGQYAVAVGISQYNVYMPAVKNRQ